MTLSEKIKNHVGKECWVIYKNDLYKGTLISCVEDIPEVLYYLKIQTSDDVIATTQEHVYFTAEDTAVGIKKEIAWHRSMIEAWEDCLYELAELK